MRILVSLPITHPEFLSVDALLNGCAPCSGTIGAIVRTAALLAQSGNEVYLSGATPIESTKIPYLMHEDVSPERFDRIVAHQSHWDGRRLTIGNEGLTKTSLLFQNETSWHFGHTFLESGGRRIITCSDFFSDRYRAIRQWRKKVTYIYNSYCPVFQPGQEKPQARLLFIGAVTPSKGFRELMQIWTYLVQQDAGLDLAIAGSIGIHSNVRVGPLGIAEEQFEKEAIIPWLEGLPEAQRPHFLGALAPVELRKEVVKSWAVIVNPSWQCSETFCISAVEAQACDRTVFSINEGGLRETVYHGAFQSLATKRSPEALGKLILNGLSSQDAVEKNGLLAGEFVRKKFAHGVIEEAWDSELKLENRKTPFQNTRGCSRAVICDLLRWTGSGILFEKHVMGRR